MKYKKYKNKYKEICNLNKILKNINSEHFEIIPQDGVSRKPNKCNN